MPVVEQDEHKLAEQTLDALLDEDSNLSPVKPMRQGSSDIVDEINAYIGCPKIMPPILAKLFRALKTIPPSSIEAERAFSTCGQFATRPRSRLNDDTLNALLITNKFYKKEKLLAKEKDLAKQKLLSKPAKAAETTETVEAVVQKSLTKNRQNIQRTSLPNDKSKTAKGSPSIKTLFQKGPGKTKASHQSKAEMEANKKKKAKKENIWTAHANSDVSDSQLNDSDETQMVFK